MRLVKTMCCAAALVACLAPGASADEWNKKTILTFSGPVQIPGVTLPAGTYVFKLADLASNRHVVQVFDKDEKKIYGTILAIPDQMLEPSDKPVVMFAERPAGSPQAIRAWFYPGNTIGNEFVYPKDQAMTIARETHTSVLSMDDTTSSTTTDEERRESMKSASVSRIDESGTTSASTSTATTTSASAAPVETPREVEPEPRAAEPTPAPEPQATTAEQAPAPTVNPAPAPSASAEPVGTSGQAERRTLPRTSSPMTLLGLLGGLSLAAGFGVRRVRTHFGR
jgi:hypothetical protein